jgi:hypothetical protein
MPIALNSYEESALAAQVRSLFPQEAGRRAITIQPRVNPVPLTTILPCGP